MTSIFQILMLILDVVWFIMIAHIIMSWLINFQVLNLRQPIVAQIWYGLNRMLEPIYGPIRRVLPDMGGIDLAPLVVLIGVLLKRRLGASPQTPGVFGQRRNNVGFFFEKILPPEACGPGATSCLPILHVGMSCCRAVEQKHVR